MTTPVRTVTVSRDDEHNVFALAIEDRSQGYARTYGIGLDFITSGEYRTVARRLSRHPGHQVPGGGEDDRFVP
jgi:hypothetical protein